MVPSKVTLEVTEISGTNNISSADQLRLVFRGVNNTVAISNVGYDFYTGYYGNGYISTSIGMFFLYSVGGNLVFDHFKFKVKAYAEESNKDVLTLDDGVTITKL